MGGKCEGVHVSNTPFLNNSEPYDDILTTHYDPKYDLTLGIKSNREYIYPIVKSTLDMSDLHSLNIDEPKLRCYED